MADIFAEHQFAEPIEGQDFRTWVEFAGGCLNTHRVEWREVYLADQGRRIFCRFFAPDAESVRLALRRLNGVVQSLWSARVQETARPEAANFGALWQFAESVAVDVWRPGADAGLVRSFCSLDRRRLFCLYRATDWRSVFQAHQAVGLSGARIWPLQSMTPCLVDSELGLQR